MTQAKNARFAEASCWGKEGLTRDLGMRRITVNLIQPGPIDTDMNPTDGPFSDWIRNQVTIPEFGQGPISPHWYHG